jgi:hypothetical protein
MVFKKNIKVNTICIAITLVFGIIKTTVAESFNKTGVNAGVTKTSGEENSRNTLTNAYYIWKRIIYQTMVLFPIAQKDFSAEIGEYNERLKMYNAIFPEIPIDSELVKNEIIIEKYLRTNEKLVTSSEQIEKEYADLSKLAINSALPPMADILPVLSCHALLSSDTVMQICWKKMKK